MMAPRTRILAAHLWTIKGIYPVGDQTGVCNQMDSQWLFDVAWGVFTASRFGVCSLLLNADCLDSKMRTGTSEKYARYEI